MPGIYLRRSAATARRVEAILGLPDSSWTGVHVEFGTDEPATAEVTLLIRPDQLHGLVEACTVSGTRTDGENTHGVGRFDMRRPVGPDISAFDCHVTGSHSCPAFGGDVVTHHEVT